MLHISTFTYVSIQSPDTYGRKLTLNLHTVHNCISSQLYPASCHNESVATYTFDVTFRWRFLAESILVVDILATCFITAPEHRPH